MPGPGEVGWGGGIRKNNMVSDGDRFSGSNHTVTLDGDIYACGVGLSSVG